MHKNATYATEVEIFALCYWSRKDAYIWHKYKGRKEKFHWIPVRASGNPANRTDTAWFIKNKDEHFEPIVSL